VLSLKLHPLYTKLSVEILTIAKPR